MLWQFFRHELLRDWYVELKKLLFMENSGLDAHWRAMLGAFEMALRLLHPVMTLLHRRAVAAPGRRLSMSHYDRACALSAHHQSATDLASGSGRFSFSRRLSAPRGTSVRI